MKYDTDLTDREFELIKHNFTNKESNYGKNRKHDKRVLINAVFYILKTRCQWRMLPKDFPHWTAVYSFFRRAGKNLFWSKLLADLVEKIRVKEGKSAGPRVCIIDSQMVKTIYASKGSKYNGWKKKRGRKRHVVTDSDGHVLDIIIHQGNIHDTKMGWKVLRKVLKRYPTIEVVIADKGY